MASAEQELWVEKLSGDLRVGVTEGVSQGDRSGSKNYVGTRLWKTSYIRWKWRGGGRREESKLSDSSIHHYTQTCSSEPKGLFTNYSKGRSDKWAYKEATSARGVGGLGEAV